MPSDKRYFGGSITITSAVPVSVRPQHGRVQNFHFTASGQNVQLWDASDLMTSNAPLGGPWFYILNNGANSFDIKDNGLNTLRNLPVDTGCFVALIDDTTSNGIWIVGSAQTLSEA